MYYILSPDGTAVRTDALTWARWFETNSNNIRKTDVGPLQVSTVFLGIDHNFSGEGPPLLFETMVFPGQQQFRHSTYKEAIMKHGLIVERLRQELKALS